MAKKAKKSAARKAADPMVRVRAATKALNVALAALQDTAPGRYHITVMGESKHSDPNAYAQWAQRRDAAYYAGQVYTEAAPRVRVVATLRISETVG